MADPSNKKIMDLSINPDPTNAWAYVVESAGNWRVQLGVANGLAVYDGAGAIPVTNGGTGATTAAGARTALGLGTIAVINSPVPVANGGTGSTTASSARTALGAVNIAGDTMTGSLDVTGNVTATGQVVAGSTITSANNFRSSTTSVTLATASAGTVLLRPNGTGTSSGQTTVEASGDMTVGGNISAGSNNIIAQNFSGISATVVIGPSTTGTTYVRPNGIGSPTAQSTFTTSLASIGTAMAVAGDFSVGSNDVTGQNFKGPTTTVVLGTTSATGTIFLRPNGVGSSTAQSTFSTTTAAIGTNMTVAGTIIASGNITGNNSDIRLKSDVRTITGALDLVSAMRGVRYTKDGEECVGFIAQEVRAVLPEVVIEGTDPLKLLAVGYGNVTAVLVEAIKELREQVDQLQTEVRLLKNPVK